MTLKQLLEILSAGDANKAVKALKSGRNKPLPDIATAMEQWDVNKHKTLTDKHKLPDKKVKRKWTDSKGKEQTEEVLQPVNRIVLPLQKRVVNNAVSFAFGNPVALNTEVDGNEAQRKILDAIRKIEKDTKLKSHNRRVYRELLRATEVAELWYHKDLAAETEYYGFKSDKKIRVAALKPFEGDVLYPFFDEYDDLIAFSREYTMADERGKQVVYLDVYTDDLFIRYRKGSNNWELVESEEHGIGKIPVVYMAGDDVDWADIQNNIDRLEFLLSKFAETNDYHASPTVFVKGQLLSMPEKGESGKVINGKSDSDAKYLSWDNAPQAVKLEIETLIRFIYSLTQTPDVSFDSVKGLSSISGVALEMLFMDAHLKVQEKKEVLDEFLQRRVNLQVHMIGKLAGLEAEAEQMEIEPEIIPYKINDETTTINNISTAVGAGILSQRTGIKMLGWVKDVDEELKQIQAEAQQKQSYNLFEPTDS